jgi:hypothetical protein
VGIGSLTLEERVTEVDIARTFDCLGMVEDNRIRYMRFPRFYKMSSCMGYGYLGGSGTVVSDGYSICIKNTLKTLN